MFERFAGSARQVVVVAQQEAHRMGHNHIGTEHLLLGMLQGSDDLAARTLVDLDVRSETVRAQLVRIVGGSAGPAELDATALRAIGIDLDIVRRKVEETFGPGALDSPATACNGRRRRGRRTRVYGHIPFTPRTKKVLELALREAARLKHNHIGTEHLLLGLLREGQGLAVRLLAEYGVELAEVRSQVLGKIQRIA